MPQIIHVAVGIIVNPEKKFLVAKRPSSVDQGDLWEFPGGKVEADEDVYAALCRELKEEINLDVLSATSFLKITHDYSNYSVLLDTWQVGQFEGELFGAENQPIQWVTFQELQNLSMPAGNQPIIDALYTRQQ